MLEYKISVENNVLLRTYLQCNDDLYLSDEMNTLLSQIKDISVYEEKKLKDLTKKLQEEDIQNQRIRLKDL